MPEAPLPHTQNTSIGINIYIPRASCDSSGNFWMHCSFVGSLLIERTWAAFADVRTFSVLANAMARIALAMYAFVDVCSIYGLDNLRHTKLVHRKKQRTQTKQQLTKTFF